MLCVSAVVTSLPDYLHEMITGTDTTEVSIEADSERSPLVPQPVNQQAQSNKTGNTAGASQCAKQHDKVLPLHSLNSNENASVLQDSEGNATSPTLSFSTLGDVVLDISAAGALPSKPAPPCYHSDSDELEDSDTDGGSSKDEEEPSIVSNQNTEPLQSIADNTGANIKPSAGAVAPDGSGIANPQQTSPRRNNSRYQQYKNDLFAFLSLSQYYKCKIRCLAVFLAVMIIAILALGFMLYHTHDEVLKARTELLEWQKMSRCYKYEVSA